MAKRKGCGGIIFILLLLVVGAALVAGFYAYNYILKDNVASDDLETELLIPTDATFEQVVDSLDANNILINKASFIQVAKAKKYNELVKPGRYLIKNDYNNLELVDFLRSGRQSPVQFIINNVRTNEDLAGRVGGKLEIDSLQILEALNSTQVAGKYGFTQQTFPSMFLANTYELYWNTSLDSFLDRMKKEYDRFWTEEREKKAEDLGLSKIEVITLASIVEEETKAVDEMPVVAGLYLNRLNKGMRLEADPTVKYAVGDFTLRRVLNKHLETKSPYNTYRNYGLPPGPIRIPELTAVDAVLSPKEHDYFYMSAKADFSGRHAFARTLREHNNNANAYRKALNERGIYK